MASERTCVVNQEQYEDLLQRMRTLKTDFTTFRSDISSINVVGVDKEGGENAPKLKEEVKEEKGSPDEGTYHLKPIGTLCSVYKELNGTPRQPGLCKEATATLTIGKHIFNNPEHSLQDLEHFSHVWVLFVFHKNKNAHTKAKVKPPRMDGKKTGVFSTRSPYRPNPVGLSLAKLDRVQGSTLYLSGIDMVDGTPVLDIKPYIPYCDNPSQQQSGSMQDGRMDRLENPGNPESDNREPDNLELDKQEEGKQEQDNPESDNSELDNSEPRNPEADDNSLQEARIAPWLQSNPVGNLTVRFTPSAQNELEKFGLDSTAAGYSLEHYDGPQSVKAAILEILRHDPRSAYRRKKCLDRLYYFSVDRVHVTCWFDDERNVAEVVSCKPQSDQQQPCK